MNSEVLKNGMNLDEVVVCLHQSFKQKRYVAEYMKPEGLGNCETCRYDSINNPKCRDYTPVAPLHIYEVK
jgi:hypothetical protein